MSRTVLVVGPELAGVGGVAAVLRAGLTECRVVESADGLPDGHPDVVVFVVSAASVISGCDVALLADAAERTDAIVAAVTKIDVHRTWRAVLERNRATVGLLAPRHREVPWVGVAADPRIGPPVTGPLLDAVSAALAERRRPQPSGPRGAESRTAQSRQDLAARRLVLRTGIRRARLELAGEARVRALALREALQDEAAVVSRRGLDAFGERLRSRVQQVADDFDSVVRHRMAELCARAGVAVDEPPPGPPVWSVLPGPRRPLSDDTLTAMFALSFGLGVALTLGRLLLALPGVSGPAVVAVCGLVGGVLALWVVRARRLAAARVALDRWVAEVAAGLRSALEERVAAAESALISGYDTTAGRASRIPGSEGRGCAILAD